MSTRTPENTGSETDRGVPTDPSSMRTTNASGSTGAPSGPGTESRTGAAKTTGAAVEGGTARSLSFPASAVSERSVRLHSRRTPPLVVWLIVGTIAVAAGACLALGALAWQEADQARMLQLEVKALRSERQATLDGLTALQATASVMENRLSTLEASDPAQQLAALRTALETAGDPAELAELRGSLDEIQATVDGFQSAVDQLSTRMDALEPGNGDAGDRLPAEARLEVARQRQSHSLSCESSAASMVAQYHGVDLSEADVLAALPRNANPHLGFRGNVDGPTGGIEDYGVYAGPILNILNGQGLKAKAVEGGLQGIKAAIARGNPVIAWVTYNCLPSTPTSTTIAGATVTLVPNQHVVVVTGYNEDGVWANDPWDGQEDFYSYADFKRALGYFDRMAIEVAQP